MKILTGALIFLVLLSGIAFAQEVVVGDLPGSWTYPFKRFAETLDLAFTFDNVAKAEKYANYAQLRLLEAHALLAQNKSEFVPDVMKEYTVQVREAARIANMNDTHALQVSEKVATKLKDNFQLLDEIETATESQDMENVVTSAKDETLNRSLMLAEKFAEQKPVDAAQFAVAIAETRVERIQAMIQKNKTDLVPVEAERYQRAIAVGMNISEIAKAHHENATSVAEIVAAATSTHLAVLSEVYDKVPEVAKPHIAWAMNASKTGNDIAVDVICGEMSPNETRANCLAEINKTNKSFVPPEAILTRVNEILPPPQIQPVPHEETKEGASTKVESKR